MQTEQPATADEAVEILPLWQQRPFRMLSYTRFTSRVANYGVNFALLLLVVQATGLAFMSSLLVLSLVIPSTLSGLVAGVAADALPKRLLIVVSNLLKTLVCVLFVVFDMGVPGLFVVGFALATVGQFAGSAEASVLPAIVARSSLVGANAIGHALQTLAQVVGFGLMTPLFIRLFDSPQALFLAAGALYFISAYYGLRIGRVVRAPRADVGGEREGNWLLAGWREIKRQPRVRQAVIQLTLIMTTVLILSGIIPVYLTEVLDLPVDIGVVVLAPAAVGMALGLRIAGLLARVLSTTVLCSFGFAGFVVLLALLGFVNEEATFLSGFGAFAWLDSIELGGFDKGALLATLIVGPLGFSFALVAVAAQTVMNDMVPLHLQGRVIATQTALAAVASSAPVLAAGALADLIGPQPVIALVAVLMGVAAYYSLREPQDVAAVSPIPGPGEKHPQIR